MAKRRVRREVSDGTDHHGTAPALPGRGRTALEGFIVVRAVRYRMAELTDAGSLSRCTNCGFETDVRGEWETVEAPPLGEVTQCPECGSTNVTIVRPAP
jgi:predicted RNA-binding Zn-ribbon protein involved in translation (DUF1610 family)